MCSRRGPAFVQERFRIQNQFPDGCAAFLVLQTLLRLLAQRIESGAVSVGAYECANALDSLRKPGLVRQRRTVSEYLVQRRVPLVLSLFRNHILHQIPQSVERGIFGHGAPEPLERGVEIARGHQASSLRRSPRDYLRLLLRPQFLGSVGTQIAQFSGLGKLRLQLRQALYRRREAVISEQLFCLIGGRL